MCTADPRGRCARPAARNLLDDRAHGVVHWDPLRTLACDHEPLETAMSTLTTNMTLGRPAGRARRAFGGWRPAGSFRGLGTTGVVAMSRCGSSPAGITTDTTGTATAANATHAVKRSARHLGSRPT